MLTVGIIGCGGVTRHQQLPAISELNNLKLSWLCDQNVERAKELAKDYTTHYFSDAELALEQSPDIVLISTPHQTHSALSIKALQAGSNVLCEKPMATSIKECKQMMAAAKKTRNKLTIAHSNRFREPMNTIYRRAEEGAYGQLVGISTFIGQEVEWDVERPWVDKLQIGNLGEHIPHGIYLATDFLENLESISTICKSHEEVYSVHSHFNSTNAIGSVFAMRQTFPTKIVQIFGTKCQVLVDLFNGFAIERRGSDLTDISIITDSYDKICSTISKTLCDNYNGISFEFIDGNKTVYSGHLSLIDDFRKSIKYDNTVPVTADQGMRVVKVLESIKNNNI